MRSTRKSPKKARKIMKKPKQKSPKQAPMRVVAPAPAPKSDLSMCAGCSAPCCSLRPELTTYDVARIMELEGRGLDFVEFTEAARDDALPISASGRQMKMTLRREDGTCVFFNQSSPLKCSIDRSKPAVCIAYPYTFSNALGKNILCPPANLSKADADMQALKDSEWEYERYKEIVQDWNSGKGGSIADFIVFAAKEMEVEKSPLGSALRRARRSVFGLFRKR